MESSTESLVLRVRTSADAADANNHFDRFHTPPRAVFESGLNFPLYAPLKPNTRMPTRVVASMQPLDSVRHDSECALTPPLPFFRLYSTSSLRLLQPHTNNIPDTDVLALVVPNRMDVSNALAFAGKIPLAVAHAPGDDLGIDGSAKVLTFTGCATEPFMLTLRSTVEAVAEPYNPDTGGQFRMQTVPKFGNSSGGRPVTVSTTDVTGKSGGWTVYLLPLTHGEPFPAFVYALRTPTLRNLDIIPDEVGPKNPAVTVHELRTRPTVPYVFYTLDAAQAYLAGLQGNGVMSAVGPSRGRVDVAHPFYSPDVVRIEVHASTYEPPAAGDTSKSFFDDFLYADRPYTQPILYAVHRRSVFPDGHVHKLSYDDWRSAYGTSEWVMMMSVGSQISRKRPFAAFTTSGGGGSDDE